jgi:GT2 family glycosyltransferase
MRSRLKSAAHQRNLALREIYTNFIYTDCHFILFLDDDVRINRDFAKKLIDNLLQWKDAVGVSPLVNDGRGSPSMVEKILPGKVLPGAINISSNGFEEETKVDWLIGCSLWRLDALRERRFYFEGDLLGQSIFEDVIFSTHLRMTGGSLIVSKVPLIHNLSKSERPNSRESMSEWILNRYRYVDLFDNSLIVFLLVNLGMCLRQIVGIASKERRQSLQGIITGTQRVLRSL